MKLATAQSGALLWLAAMLLLGGCERQPAPPTVTHTTSSATIEAPPASASSSTESSAAAPNLDQAAEFSETETPAEAPSDPTLGQSLNLKLNEYRTPAPSRWKEGVNYTRLVPAQSTNAPPGQIEVVEAFWYGCPHCAALDPALENWRLHNKPAYVWFDRLPVMWGPAQVAHAQLFYTVAALGKLDELHGKLFDAVQKQGLNDVDSMAKFMAAQGINDNDFRRTYNSDAVAASLKQAQVLGLRYTVDKVPTIIINGKYVTDLGKAGGAPQLLALINDLTAIEKSSVK